MNALVSAGQARGNESFPPSDLGIQSQPVVHVFPDTGQAVRTVVIDGEPWFVAADLAEVLGLANIHSSLALLDDDERGIQTMDTPSGLQQLATVNEAGLYSLTFRSRKPAAKQFKRWVTHEVLPAIRRTGTFSVATIDRRELAQMILAEADRADLAEAKAAQLAPAAEAWEVLAEGTGNYSLREAAAILTQDPAINIGQNRLMTFIRDEGMVDGKGRPYAKHNRHLVQRPVSYNHPRTGEPQLTVQLRITPEGIAYLRKRLGGVRQEAA